MFTKNKFIVSWANKEKNKNILIYIIKVEFENTFSNNLQGTKYGKTAF